MWEVPNVNAVKVDEKNRVRLSIFKPGDLYEPDYTDSNIITLRKVTPPEKKPKVVRHIGKLVRKDGFLVFEAPEVPGEAIAQAVREHREEE